MKPVTITRRTLISRGAAAGVAAGLSPLLPVFEAKAQTDARGLGKRLMLVYWSGGTAFDNYLPTGTETNWTMSKQMAALTPFKQKMTIYANMRRSQDNAKGSHQAGTSGIWTAARMLGTANTGWVSHPSIDQIIAKEVPQKTEIPVFHLDAMSQDPGNLRGNTTYGLDRLPIHGEMDPSRAFDRLFTNGIATPMVGGAPADPMAGDKLRAKRKSVLDLVRFELQTLTTRLGGQDRKKLDQHLEQIRSAESRLTAPAGATGGGAIPGWTPPTSSSVPKLGFTFKDQANFPQIVKLQMDMAVAALAADKSRIVTLQLNQGNGDIVYRWLGVNTPHHALTHGGDDNAGLGAIQRWYYEQFAYMLGAMDSVKEGGGTLLDNTLTVIGNEFVSGTAHDTDPWPVFIAGSGGGGFKTGRFVNYPAAGGARLFPGHPDTQSNQPFHTQFLTSVCHHMGAMVQRVGDPSCGPAGPLPQFT